MYYVYKNPALTRKFLSGFRRPTVALLAAALLC